MLPPLIERAIAWINSEDQNLVAEGFLILAEVVSVNRIQNFCSDPVPEANDILLEWGPLHTIQRNVLQWIEQHPDHPSVASAFWVLDKFHDDSLRPFLRTWLQHYVDKILPTMSPIGQLLVNLGSFGDDTISGGSYFAEDYGKNLADAVRYLRTNKKER